MLKKYKDMQEGYAIRDPSKPHYVTLTVVDWIDVFTRRAYYKKQFI